MCLISKHWQKTAFSAQARGNETFKKKKKKGAILCMQISRVVKVNTRYSKQTDKVKATRLLQPIGIWQGQEMKLVLEKNEC